MHIQSNMFYYIWYSLPSTRFEPLSKACLHVGNPSWNFTHSTRGNKSGCIPGACFKVSVRVSRVRFRVSVRISRHAVSGCKSGSRTASTTLSEIRECKYCNWYIFYRRYDISNTERATKWWRFPESIVQATICCDFSDFCCVSCVMYPLTCGLFKCTLILAAPISILSLFLCGIKGAVQTLSYQFRVVRILFLVWMRTCHDKWFFQRTRSMRSPNANSEAWSFEASAIYKIVLVHHCVGLS